MELKEDHSYGLLEFLDLIPEEISLSWNMKLNYSSQTIKDFLNDRRRGDLSMTENKFMALFNGKRIAIVREDGFFVYYNNHLEENSPNNVPDYPKVIMGPPSREIYNFKKLIAQYTQIPIVIHNDYLGSNTTFRTFSSLKKAIDFQDGEVISDKFLINILPLVKPQLIRSCHIKTNLLQYIGEPLVIDHAIYGGNDGKNK